MATKTRRRLRRDSEPRLGKESWLIVAGDGKVLREVGHSEGSALIMAQKLAEKSLEPVAMTVQVKSLFGDPDTLYRVVRDEDGVVLTRRT